MLRSGKEVHPKRRPKAPSSLVHLQVPPPRHPAAHPAATCPNIPSVAEPALTFFRGLSVSTPLPAGLLSDPGASSMQPTPQLWDFALPNTLHSNPSLCTHSPGLLRNQCCLTQPTLRSWPAGYRGRCYLQRSVHSLRKHAVPHSPIITPTLPIRRLRHKDTQLLAGHWSRGEKKQTYED